jgi:hypothetical protein
MWPGKPTMNFSRRISKESGVHASREARSSGLLSGGGGRCTGRRGFKAGFADSRLMFKYPVQTAHPPAAGCPDS